MPNAHLGIYLQIFRLPAQNETMKNQESRTELLNGKLFEEQF